MKALHMIAFILVIVGGLNWLVFGIFGWDVGQIFGEDMTNIVAKIIYILVGLSAIYLLFTHKKDCRACAPGSASAGGSGM